MADAPPHRRAYPLSEAQKVALLKRPDTYQEKPARIDILETHMSWLFLTEHHAYKLKKPVRYEFLNFSTLTARQKNCAEEVRLNRRLAPDVYLGTVPLTMDAEGKGRLGGHGTVIDWLVQMRRLPAERMLDHLIGQDKVREEHLHKVALILTKYYQRTPPIAIDQQRYRHQLEQDIRTNRRWLMQSVYGLPVDLIETVHRAQLGFLQREPALFLRRVTEGRIVEGHGDLRPEHICLEPHPVIFDCLEFKRRFRIIDTVDELGFLALECERLGASWIGPVLFRVYGQATGDSPPARLVHFYKAYRACLRARLAICHTHELAEEHWRRWQDLADDYLELARNYSRRLG